MGKRRSTFVALTLAPLVGVAAFGEPFKAVADAESVDIAEVPSFIPHSGDCLLHFALD